MASLVRGICCALIAILACIGAGPARAQDTIKIGYVDPFSGPFASGGDANGLASRIRARRSVYFHSSMRRCGSPSASKRPKAVSRSADTFAPPGRRARTAAKASLKASEQIQQYRECVALMWDRKHPEDPDWHYE